MRVLPKNLNVVCTHQPVNGILYLEVTFPMGLIFHYGMRNMMVYHRSITGNR